MSVGYQNEIKEGLAYILTTVDGNQVQKYEVVIEEINRQSKPSTKSMAIRVTEKGLIAKTGGIVQGMNGIFIEWMLQQSDCKINHLFIR